MNEAPMALFVVEKGKKELGDHGEFR